MTRRNIWSVLFNPKVISVLLAVLLWVYVAGVRGPDTTKSVEAPVVAVNLPQGYVVSGTLPTVTVTLRGPMNTLWNVTSSYVTPTIDLRGRSEGTFAATVQVQVAGLAGVTVQNVTPSEVSVQLESLRTVSVPVHAEVTGTLPAGMVLGMPHAEPPTVEVSGPSSLVSIVKEAAVVVSLDKLGTPAGGNLTVAGDVVAFDAEGNTVTGVLLSPQSAAAILPILDSSRVRTLPVLPVIGGRTAAGYAVGSTSCTPAVVMVTGEPDVLGQLKVIPTSAVDVSDRSGVVTRDVELALPSGVSLISGGKVVTCRIALDPVVVLAIPDVPVQVRGAGSTWKVTIGTTSVSVLVSGTSAAIASLGSSQVKAYVDVSQAPLADGSYPISLEGLTQGVISATATPSSIQADIQKEP
ncbi:MAG TPA: CdaR family protein [Candidatus Cryosericum sp.]|nr:CdaR family protein [Candidatus Cryosericum sp.]